jgi:hypothetical protein
VKKSAGSFGLIKLRPIKPTAEGRRFGRRISGHFNFSVAALFVPFGLSVIILVTGSYLSELIKIDPDSILFRLWPYNSIYFRQFATSHYTKSEIDWFFTVVSCSNFVWLLFLGWKIVFELFRRDVSFPSDEMPGFTRAFLYLTGVFGFLFVAFLITGPIGFNTYRNTTYGLSLSQSITTGALKIVLGDMFLLYFSAAGLLEWGGLGLRYVVVKLRRRF